MLFRNAIRLLTENFKSVYKIMLYKFIVTLVSVALCCAMILPQLLEIWNNGATQELLTDFRGFLMAFFEANGTELDATRKEIFDENGSLQNFAQLLLSRTAPIVWGVIGCIIVYLVKRYAETICYFTVGSILNDKMSTYAETPFMAALVANLGKASLYALVYVPLVFVIDVATTVLCILFMATLDLFSALFLSMLVIVLVQTTKLTLTGLWMPSVTADGKSLFQSFRYADNTERKQTGKIFSTYLISVYVIIIVNAMAALFTVGTALIITVPASYMLLICQQYVNYYTIKGKKYFITYDRIASNPDRGDREHFFEYIDETAPQSSETATTEENKGENAENTENVIKTEVEDGVSK